MGNETFGRQIRPLDLGEDERKFENVSTSGNWNYRYRSLMAVTSTNLFKAVACLMISSVLISCIKRPSTVLMEQVVDRFLQISPNSMIGIELCQDTKFASATLTYDLPSLILPKLTSVQEVADAISQSNEYWAMLRGRDLLIVPKSSPLGSSAHFGQAEVTTPGYASVQVKQLLRDIASHPTNNALTLVSKQLDELPLGTRNTTWPPQKSPLMEILDSLGMKLGFRIWVLELKGSKNAKPIVDLSFH